MTMEKIVIVVRDIKEISSCRNPSSVLRLYWDGLVYMAVANVSLKLVDKRIDRIFHCWFLGVLGSTRSPLEVVGW